MTIKIRPVITVEDERIAARCAKGRVVIIDDDAEILQALQALLEFEGFAVDSYASAAAYLEALAANLPQFAGPSCVLCDVNMPVLSGLELQRRLIEHNDKPLILMSGVSGAQEAATAFRAGALDFLVKPIDADTLLAAVQRALQVSATRLADSLRKADLQQRASTLTERETAVLKSVAKGMTNQAVAEQLAIALRTVKLHRQRGM